MPGDFRGLAEMHDRACRQSARRGFLAGVSVMLALAATVQGLLFWFRPNLPVRPGWQRMDVKSSAGELVGACEFREGYDWQCSRRAIAGGTTSGGLR